MKRRFLAAILALAMTAACFTACGDSSKNDEKASSSKADSSSQAETTTTTAKSEPETTTTTTAETTTTTEQTTTATTQASRVGIPYSSGKLRIANSYAKLAFTTVNNKAAEMVSDGIEVGKIETDGKVSVASLKESTNPILKSVYDIFADGEVNDEDLGYVYIIYDTTDEPVENFAQWSEDSTGTYIGQFPDEITAINWSTVQFGTKQK